MRALLIPLVALILGGCFPCGRAGCPDASPIRSELLVVDLYEDTVVEDLERIDVMVQGDLDIQDDAVVLTYADVDGNIFEVTWERL